MIRRILAGAAIAGAALGFCVSAASADVGPNPYIGAPSLLSQLSTLDNLTGVSDAAKYTNIPTTANLQDVNLHLLNNNR
ncbi:hypothetical protein AB0L53_27780 [Nonomuraea sp. NPDC052129]|uniref:hypothetical protein n=1 Tax=unclassified Nonomuraea TaxID=2593643 RepID=UPI0033F775C1